MLSVCISMRILVDPCNLITIQVKNMTITDISSSNAILSQYFIIIYIVYLTNCDLNNYNVLLLIYSG